MIISRKIPHFAKALLIVSAILFKADMALSQATEGRPFPDLEVAIGKCFKGDAKIPKDAYAIINFKLDASGQLIGLPELMSDDPVDADTRRLYLLGFLALEGCAPYPSTENEMAYNVMFDPFILIALLPDETGTASTADTKPPSTTLNPTATKETEKALELTKSDRREIQQRLTFLGYDTGGADGVLGKKSRVAISSWQTARDFSASGYLDDVQWSALKNQDDGGYQTWKVDNTVSTPSKPRRLRRVKVCRKVGLGLRKCRYEYR